MVRQAAVKRSRRGQGAGWNGGFRQERPAFAVFADWLTGGHRAGIVVAGRFAWSGLLLELSAPLGRPPLRYPSLLTVGVTFPPIPKTRSIRCTGS